MEKREGEEMNYIKVWCEYDFNGSFGGYNNESVFIVEEGGNIEKLVLRMLMKNTCLTEDELEGFYDWDFIEVEELK